MHPPDQGEDDLLILAGVRINPDWGVHPPVGAPIGFQPEPSPPATGIGSGSEPDRVPLYRPGERSVTSWISQLLPSGSSKVTKLP